MALNDFQIKTHIKKAKETGKLQKPSDGAGLQLWVKPDGKASWWLAYRLDKKQKSLSLGPYPLVSLAEARAKRDEAKKHLLDDKDPHAEKAKASSNAADARSNTFSVVALEWLEKRRQDNKDPKTIVQIERLIGAAIDTPMGPKPIADITKADVLDAIRSKYISRGKIDTAWRMKARLNEVFEYAIELEMIEKNPADRINKLMPERKKTKSHGAIIEPGPFGEFLRRLDADTKMEGSTRLAIQLFVLTYQRSEQVRLAEWSHIDFEKAVWRFPASNMKGRKNDPDAADFVIPLATQTVAILKELQAMAGGSKLVLPSLYSKWKPISENTTTAAIVRMGYERGSMTTHGFRATASSMLEEKGFREKVIEFSLAHVEEDEVKKAYFRQEYWEQRVEMAQKWADMVDAMKSVKQD